MSKELNLTRMIITTYLNSADTPEALKEAIIIASKSDEKLFLEHIKALIEIFTKAKEELERWQNDNNEWLCID